MPSWTIAKDYKAFIGGFCAIFQCPTTSGTFTSRVCCSDLTDEKTGCCNNTFDLNNLWGNWFVPEGEIDGASAIASSLAASQSSLITSQSPTAPPISADPSLASITPSSVIPPSSSVTPSSKPTVPSKKSAAIGAGIGVPLGAIFLSGLGLFLVKEHRRRLFAEKTVNSIHAANQRGNAKDTQVGNFELGHHPTPQELEYTQTQPVELQSRDVLEAGTHSEDGMPGGGGWFWCWGCVWRGCWVLLGGFGGGFIVVVWSVGTTGVGIGSWGVDGFCVCVAVTYMRYLLYLVLDFKFFWKWSLGV